MLIKLIGLLMSVTIIYFFVSQITLPAILNKPFFPLFRSKYRKARQRLTSAHQMVDIAELNELATDVHTSAAKKELKTSMRIKDVDSEFQQIIEEKQDERKRVQ